MNCVLCIISFLFFLNFNQPVPVSCENIHKCKFELKSFPCFCIDFHLMISFTFIILQLNVLLVARVT